MDWNTCHNMSKDLHAIQKYEMLNLSNVFPGVQNLSIMSNEPQNKYFDKVVVSLKHESFKKIVNYQMTLYTNPIATRLFNNNVFIVAWVLDTYFIAKNVITLTLEDDFK